MSKRKHRWITGKTSHWIHMQLNCGDKLDNKPHRPKERLWQSTTAIDRQMARMAKG